VTHRSFPLAAVTAAVATALAAWQSTAGAAGFALIEQGASGLGNAYAGAAALGEDASTVWFNPAGMTRLDDKRQVLLAGHAVSVNAEFENTNSVGATAPAPRPVGSNGGNAGGIAAIPNFYATIPVAPGAVFGIGLSAPFGLTTDYGVGWAGRFQSLKSEVQAINLNPSIAMKVNDRVSIGVGFNLMTFNAELSRAANLGLSEGVAKLDGYGVGFGVNGGVLWQVTDATRVGFSYRSQIDQGLRGTQEVRTAAGNLVPGQRADVGLDLSLPAMASLSAVHDLNDRWALLGDVSWTQWNVIDVLDVRDNAGTLRNQLDFKFRNAWRVSGAVNWKWNERLKLRLGTAWDQSPVVDATRTAALPDADRVWLAIGASWQATEAITLDAGYAHLFLRDGSIDHSSFPSAAATGRLRGNYSGSVDILSAQLVWKF
jgi:long-chain fatty acid transport protein